MNGILNIDKPYGRTSFDIVAMVKRLSGERRVGHAGTLDPSATGVLPVCLGQGTRIVEFLVDMTKVYRAEIEMGAATDTYDASGETTFRGDISGIDQGKVESALTAFRGLIKQTPPMYSAVKYKGKPLYQWARAGINVERKSRSASIYHLELIDWRPPLVTVEVECGKGTYIRSLAHDLGQSLGCGANLKNLIRLRCGPFHVGDAVSVTQLEYAFNYGYWQRFVAPIDIVLSHWAAIVVSDNASQAIKNGQPLALSETNNSGAIDQFKQNFSRRSSSYPRCRAYTTGGCFLGVLHFDSERGQWQPEKVFL